MAGTAKMSFEEFTRLPEREGPIYELDEGELLMEPSPAARHNLIRKRVVLRLDRFVQSHRLGMVLDEMDFRLGPDTVRSPDVAFVTIEHLNTLDLDRSPLEGAPALAIEVISPSDSAQDMLKKVCQYLEAGAQAVWLLYPTLRLAEIYDGAGIRTVTALGSIREEKLFPGLVFLLSLAEVFEPDPMSS
jgi:Uma2 family endonuclease